MIRASEPPIRAQRPTAPPLQHDPRPAPHRAMLSRHPTRAQITKSSHIPGAPSGAPDYCGHLPPQTGRVTVRNLSVPPSEPLLNTGVSPRAGAPDATYSGKDRREARMSGSDKVIWLVCCGGLTGLGLIMSWLM